MHARGHGRISRPLSTRKKSEILDSFKRRAVSISSRGGFLERAETLEYDFGEGRASAGETADDAAVEGVDHWPASDSTDHLGHSVQNRLFDEIGLAVGALVELQREVSAFAAKLRERVLETFVVGDVDGSRETWKEAIRQGVRIVSFVLGVAVPVTVWEVVGQRADDTESVGSDTKHRAATATTDVGTVNQVTVRVGVDEADSPGEEA